MDVARRWLERCCWSYKQHYESLRSDDFEVEQNQDFSTPTRNKKKLLAGLKYILLVSIVPILVICLCSSALNLFKPLEQDLATIPPSYLRLLITTKPGPASTGLCRNIHSITILGFPTPTLINWSQSPNHASASTRRIAGILTHLNSISLPELSEDVVVIADEAAFFQLRPDVLLDRFSRINDAANAELRLGLSRAVDIEDIKQEVIFAARKTCSSSDVASVACYGALNRPVAGSRRYLDPAMAIGSVHAMRKVYERAWEYAMIEEEAAKADAVAAVVSNASLALPVEEPLALIFGEQNIQREFLRLHHHSRFQRLRDSTGGFLGRSSEASRQNTEETSLLDPKHPASAYLARHYKGAPFEFGIGLDHGNDLWAAEEDVETRVFADATVVPALESEVAIMFDSDYEEQETEPGEGMLRLPNLPNDIALSTPPFYTPHTIPLRDPRNPTSDNSSLPLQSWADILLLLASSSSSSSSTSASVPVAVFSSASSLSVNSSSPQPWFQQYIPNLLAAAAAAPRQPLAVTRYGRVEKAWWGLQARDRRGGGDVGVFVGEGAEWRGLGDVCGWEEVV